MLNVLLKAKSVCLHLLLHPATSDRRNRMLIMNDLLKAKSASLSQQTSPQTTLLRQM